jgi:hypothetical protein
MAEATADLETSWSTWNLNLPQSATVDSSGNRHPLVE